MTNFWKKYWGSETEVPLEEFLACLCNDYSLDVNKDAPWLLGEMVLSLNRTEEHLQVLHKHDSVGLFIYAQINGQKIMYKPYFDWVCQHIKFDNLGNPEVVEKMRKSIIQERTIKMIKVLCALTVFATAVVAGVLMYSDLTNEAKSQRRYIGMGVGMIVGVLVISPFVALHVYQQHRIKEARKRLF